MQRFQNLVLSFLINNSNEHYFKDHNENFFFNNHRFCFFANFAVAQMTTFSQGDILSAGAMNQNFNHLQNSFSIKILRPFARQQHSCLYCYPCKKETSAIIATFLAHSSKVSVEIPIGSRPLEAHSIPLCIAILAKRKPLQFRSRGKLSTQLPRGSYNCRGPRNSIHLLLIFSKKILQVSLKILTFLFKK